MRFSAGKRLAIQCTVVLLVAVVAFALSYFTYYQPQMQVLISQLELQQQGQERDDIHRGLQLLQQRVDTKYPYAPDDPTFGEVESLAVAAWGAMSDGDMQEANKLIKDGFELLKTIKGPPTIYDPCGWGECGYGGYGGYSGW